MTKPKREWVYLGSPKFFDIPPHNCGHDEQLWSEYQKHLWCPRCQMDYIPQSNGVFDTPVPMQLSYMLGLRFDRMWIESKKIEYFNHDTAEYQDHPYQPK